MPHALDFLAVQEVGFDIVSSDAPFILKVAAFLIGLAFLGLECYAVVLIVRRRSAGRS